MTPAQFTAKRHALGLRQIDMARLLGKSENHLQRYESGYTPIPKPVEIALHYIDKKNMHLWLDYTA